MNESELGSLDAGVLGLVYASETSIHRLVLPGLRFDLLRALHRAVCMCCFRVDENSYRDAWMRSGIAKLKSTWVSTAAP